MITAVEITCEILDVFQESEEVGVTELSQKLGYSKSTIHDHLSTLLESGYVVKSNGSYELSLYFLDVAEYIKESFENYDVIQEELDKLSNETGEIVQFGTVEQHKLVYVYKSKGAGAIESASHPGKRVHLHSTGLGKAILSELPQERVDRIIEETGLPSKTVNTIDDRSYLLEELEAIRDRGFALDDEELIEGIRCVAAPVTRADGSVLGGVSVTGPVQRLEGDRFREKVPKMVMRTTNIIELNNQYS